MRRTLPAWLKLLLGGMILLSTNAQGCVADALRDAADEIDNNQSTTIDDLINDLEHLFD